MDPKPYTAVTVGDSTLVSKFLKEAKENLYQQQSDQNKNTILHIAAMYSNVQVVKVILETLPTTIVRSKNSRDDTALHVAARYNNVEVIKYLLSCAMDLDEAENQCNRYQTAKLKNREGNTALHETVRGRHREVIEVLMQSDKEVIFMKNNRRESPLYLAADRGLLFLLAKMLKVAIKENEKFKGICVNILLDNKKELISRADADGRNPLHFAASFGLCEEARSLLRIDASIAHQRDDEGLSSIHIAANNGCISIIQAMLEYFPKAIETSNIEVQNVIHLATKNGRSNLVSYMLHQKSKFGKLINAKDINGNTPLHFATMNLHPKVVSILMQKGDVNMMTIINGEGLTALDIAEMKQMDESHETFSLRKVLTLTALRINNAPSSSVGPPQIIEEKISKGNGKREYYEKKFKERFNTLVVVATLISTVTFAAGFTVPGGYNDDGPYNGMATLLRNPAFIVFVSCNTMALYLSIFIVVNNIWAQLGDIRLLVLAVNLSLPLLCIALIRMAIAFAAVLLVLFNVLYMSKYPVLKYFSKLGFYLLIYT
ncbi:protein ACCELERATED CELL DEATH 6-like [Macadamia integrifolia]|uniref:protein ACCELERATED CELL DEATH 6-like n=1 Tax=Macadamia integrifolia TaxID=60698 RepID=UPI001C4F58BE|nr:protein ACCELERATED CELL DEATH 6-like [Macadamia integrifolia]